MIEIEMTFQKRMTVQWLHHPFSQNQYLSTTIHNPTMFSAGPRGFSSGGKRALRWVGATKKDFSDQNPGENGPRVIEAVEKIEALAGVKVYVLY